MKRRILFLIAVAGVCFTACKKEPGIGGDASIHGKVHVKHYNTTFTQLISEYDGPDIYVYLIFGNNISYGKRIKTTYDGNFEFKYLYEGDYKVYAYSIDSLAAATGQVKPNLAIVKNVSITDRTQAVDIGKLSIFQ